MKRLLPLSLMMFVLTIAASAQDEGEVVKRERIDKSKSIYVLGGPSLTSLKNDADYDAGFNFELGYQKRMNRIFSLGFAVSYINFPFSPTYISTPVSEIVGGTELDYNFFYDDGGSVGRLVYLEGGDQNMTSLSVNLKFNFIPVKDKTVASLYGFAKPFVARSVRESVSGAGFLYNYNANSDSWLYDETAEIDIWDEADFPVLAEKTKITGGMFLGLGLEFFPARRFSFFVQLAAGYTLPVNIVSFNDWGTTISDDYFDDNFPMADQKFLTVNGSFGLSVNF